VDERDFRSARGRPFQITFVVLEGFLPLFFLARDFGKTVGDDVRGFGQSTLQELIVEQSGVELAGLQIGDGPVYEPVRVLRIQLQRPVETRQCCGVVL